MSNSNNTGISIIMKAGSIEAADEVFKRYMQYGSAKKELILVHNGDTESFERWLELSRIYPMVRIYRLRPETSEQDCFNYCIERSIYANTVILNHSEVQ
jgi:hypothetical protein